MVFTIVAAVLLELTGSRQPVVPASFVVRPALSDVLCVREVTVYVIRGIRPSNRRDSFDLFRGEEETG